MKKNRKFLYPILLYSLIYVISMLPMLTGFVEPLWDALEFHFPVVSYIIDILKQGHFPLWDPYSNGGIPFHAEPLNPILSPVIRTISLLWSSPYPAFMSYWVFLWWWGGIGIILLTRTYNISPRGSVITALLYIFSGFYIGHAQHISFIRVASWMPWLFFFAELSMQKKNLGYALFASLALGIASYGGYPILLFFAGFTLFIWLLVRHASRQTLPRIIVHTGIIGLGTIIMWLPTLISFILNGPDFTPKSSPLPPMEAHYSNRFTAFSFFSFISPYSNIVGQPLINTDISMANGYIGIFSIPLLIILAIHLKTKYIKIKKYILAALFFFLIPLGGYGLVKIALYYTIPPFQYMNYNSPFRLAWIFLAVLAVGYSITLLENENNLVKKYAKIFPSMLIPYGIAYICLLGMLKYKSLLNSKHIVFLSLPLAIMLIYTLIQTLYLKKGYSSKNLVTILLLFIVLDAGIHCLSNNYTICRKRNFTTAKHITHNRKTTINGSPGNRILHYPQEDRFYNKQYISKEFMVFSYTQLTDNDYRQLTYNSLFKNIMLKNNFYWLSPGVETYTQASEIIKLLSAIKENDPVPVFVQAKLNLSNQRAAFGSFGKISMLMYSPEYITMEITVPGTNNAFLASTERFARDWNVFIDGKKQAVIKHNLFFRGAVVPAGKHIVEWKYSPGYWLPLVILSYSYLVIALFTGLVIIRRSRTNYYAMLS